MNRTNVPPPQGLQSHQGDRQLNKQGQHSTEGLRCRGSEEPGWGSGEASGERDARQGSVGQPRTEVTQAEGQSCRVGGEKKKGNKKSQKTARKPSRQGGGTAARGTAQETMLASLCSYLQSENKKAAEQEGGPHTSATGLHQPDAGGFLSKLSGGRCTIHTYPHV